MHVYQPWRAPFGGSSYAKTEAAFVGHFAESDEFESDDSIRAFGNAVRSAGREITIHTYPGMTH
jgi:carboxymethylenebutenolidase